MKRKQTYLSLWTIGAAAVVTAMALTAATYAWFSSNREVETETVTARTGSVQLELQISKDNPFSPGQNNEVTLKEREHPLMPVSTYDLKNFVFCPYTDKNDNASTFQVVPEVPDERNYYYHDTVYLRAVGSGVPEGTRMTLYLDTPKDSQTGAAIPVVRAPDGSELLKAARLGLIINEGSPVFFNLSGQEDEESGNTEFNGTILESGYALGFDAEKDAFDTRKVELDTLDQYQISENGIPTKSLITMELDQVYRVDIFFYLEGCDPDCVSADINNHKSVSEHEAYLNLAFIGLQEDSQ